MPKETPFIRKPIAVFISAVCSAFPLNALAQEADNQETMQVWGTQISNNSSLLSEDIEVKQADHLSDLLRDQPGIDIGGSHPLNQSISIRGVSELDLDISIDGVDQSNNVFHHVGNLLINPDIIKAVDLQVGKNSVINGGLGGGVAFETKDAKDLLTGDQQFGMRVYGGIASNDYYNYSATAYTQIKQFDILAYYSLMDRDNFEDGDGVQQIGEDGEMQNYIIKAGWDINNANRLEFSYDYYKDEGDYRLKSNLGVDYSDHQIYPISYTRETISLNHSLFLSTTEVHTTLYRNEMNYNPDQRGYVITSQSGTSAGKNEEGITENTGLKILAETNFELADTEQVARYGIEGMQQQSERYSNSVLSLKEETESFALYAENEMELLTGFFLTPGVRYDHHAMDTMSSDDTFTDTTFALATKYLVNQQWTLRASAAQLFKGPQLPGSYVTTTVSDNPDLKAETGVNYELGASFEDHQIAGLDTLGFSITLFQSNIDDYINDAETGKYGIDNQGDVEIKGIESSVSARRGNLSGRLTYAHSDSEFTAINDSYTGGDAATLGGSLDDEAGDSLSLNLGYAVPTTDLLVSWTSMLTLDLDADADDDLDKKGYDVHNLSVQWNPARIEGLSITAGLENIFDETYYSHASYSNADYGIDYEPGRNAKLSAAYSF